MKEKPKFNGVEGKEAFERFRALAQGLIRVPKNELKKPKQKKKTLKN